VKTGRPPQKITREYSEFSGRGRRLAWGQAEIAEIVALAAAGQRYRQIGALYRVTRAAIGGIVFRQRAALIGQHERPHGTAISAPLPETRGSSGIWSRDLRPISEQRAQLRTRAWLPR
jgi:hypothetical protein